MAQSDIVSKFEGMGVEEIPVTVTVKSKGREDRAAKIVKIHNKNYENSKGKSYDDMPIPIIYTEKADGDGVYKVYGESSKSYYAVYSSNDNWSCECYDFRYRMEADKTNECKHIMAIKLCIDNKIPILDKQHIMDLMENIEQ